MSLTIIMAQINHRWICFIFIHIKCDYITVENTHKT